MKRAIALIALLLAEPAGGYPILAHAQNMMPENSYWIPPEQYDKPFTAGPVIVVRGDEKLMSQMCPKTAFPITLGCHVKLGSTTPNPVCFLVIAKDEILAAQGWNYGQLRRHERAHCNGWPADHPGMLNAKGDTKSQRKIVQQ